MFCVCFVVFVCCCKKKKKKKTKKKRTNNGKTAQQKQQTQKRKRATTTLFLSCFCFFSSFFVGRIWGALRASCYPTSGEISDAFNCPSSSSSSVSGSFRGATLGSLSVELPWGVFSWSYPLGVFPWSYPLNWVGSCALVPLVSFDLNLKDLGGSGWLREHLGGSWRISKEIGRASCRERV